MIRGPAHANNRFSDAQGKPKHGPPKAREHRVANKCVARPSPAIAFALPSAPACATMRTHTAAEEGAVATFHDFTMNTITGEALSFEQYKGAACLVVNLASQ